MPKKFAIVSGAGLLTTIFTLLASEVAKQGGNEEDIHRLTTPEGARIMEEIAGLVVKAGYPQKRNFDIVVDYDQSLKEMIKAGGYDYIDNDITAEHFPVEGEGEQKKTIILLHFNKIMTSDEVMAEMDKQGFRPAKIEDLLVLGKTEPELQRQFLIVALGSVWRDLHNGRHVSYLHWSGLGRYLNCHWFEDGWSASNRFVALRK